VTSKPPRTCNAPAATPSSLHRTSSKTLPATPHHYAFTGEEE